MTSVAGSLRVDGRTFVNDHGVFRPLFVSAFGTIAQALRGRDPRAYLQWAKATGFNGVRLFAGNLGWMDGQTAAEAVEALPNVLALVAQEGLYAEVVALTDTGAAPQYDKAAQVRAVARVCNEVGNGVLEVANEPYHATQDDETHKAQNLLQWGRVSDVPFALGAAEIDELDKPAALGGSYPTAGGSFSTVHLRRGQIWFVQMSRMREQEEISRRHNCLVMNNEPVGWDEQGTDRVRGGSRLDLPEAFFLLGASSRVMELGVVGHGQHALRSELPGRNQQACADALIRGHRAVSDGAGTSKRLTFKNGHWDDCPAGGTFVKEQEGEKPGHQDRLWRVHAGLADNRAAVVLVGIHGNPGVFWRGGWHQTALVDETEHVKVLVAER